MNTRDKEDHNWSPSPNNLTMQVPSYGGWWKRCKREKKGINAHTTTKDKCHDRQHQNTKMMYRACWWRILPVPRRATMCRRVSWCWWSKAGEGREPERKWTAGAGVWGWRHWSLWRVVRRWRLRTQRSLGERQRDARPLKNFGVE